MLNPLLHKICLKQAQIGVIGLGYVGLPLVIAFHKAGFRVIGFDCDQRKVDLFAAGASYIKHLEPCFDFAFFFKDQCFKTALDCEA